MDAPKGVTFGQEGYEEPYTLYSYPTQLCKKCGRKCRVTTLSMDVTDSTGDQFAGSITWPGCEVREIGEMVSRLEWRKKK